MTYTRSHQKPFLGKILGMACLTLSLLPTAHATIYKWVDNEGNTHYSDERPQNKKIEIQKIRVRTITKQQKNTEKASPQKARTATGNNTITVENTVKNTQQEVSVAEMKQKKTNIRQAKQQRCTQARTELAVLNKDIPVYLDDTEQYRLNWAGDTYTGERNYLTDDEREVAINKAKKTITEYCYSPNDEEAQTIARKKWARSEYCLLNQAVFKDLQRADIKASERQLNKQQALIDKYCNDAAIATLIDEPEPEIFPR